MRVVENVVELIGRTPMIRLGALKEPGEADVFAKLEYLNPGMSVKDRTALGLVRAAEESGALKPGGTILEATAGNTGVGLALVGVSRGYRVVIVMVEGYAREKMILIRGLGGEIVLVPHEAGIQGAVAKAAELAASIPGAVPMRQFENPANALVHYETTGPEIWEQLEGRVDGIAIGVGTGGTFSGIARFLKEKDPAIRCWGVEPPDSIYGGTGGNGEHMVEGIGNKLVPGHVRPRPGGRDLHHPPLRELRNGRPPWDAGPPCRFFIRRERRRGQASGPNARRGKEGGHPSVRPFRALLLPIRLRRTLRGSPHPLIAARRRTWTTRSGNLRWEAES